jgi:hypothetical protein
MFPECSLNVPRILTHLYQTKRQALLDAKRKTGFDQLEEEQERQLEDDRRARERDVEVTNVPHLFPECS